MAVEYTPPHLYLTLTGFISRRDETLDCAWQEGRSVLCRVCIVFKWLVWASRWIGRKRQVMTRPFAHWKH